MKKIVQKIARNFGVELTHFKPTASPAAQLARVLEISSIDVVFDVGANEGQFASGIRAGGYTGKIVSFEPLTSARKKLINRAARDRNWIVHEQCAIGDQDGEIEIHIAGNSVSSSVLPMLESHSSVAVDSAYVATEKVPIRRLDSVSEFHIPPQSNLFIKIDTQGYEWQVLNGAEQTMQSARGLLCELSLLSLYDGQRLWREIIDRLDAQDFDLWALQKGFTDPQTGRSLQMDGIFLRRGVV